MNSSLAAMLTVETQSFRQTLMIQTASLLMNTFDGRRAANDASKAEQQHEIRSEKLQGAELFAGSCGWRPKYCIPTDINEAN